MSTAALSHRKPASVGTSHDSCSAQGHHKRDTALVLTVKPGLNRSMLLLESVFVVTRVKIATS